MGLIVSPLRASLAALALASSVPALAQQPAGAEPARPELALMGTIPIYWGEAAGLLELLLGGGYEAHWARAALEAQWRLAPLDYLSQDALEGHDRMLLAQPRGLAPEENVALDEWVAAGGRLLLFADPWITGHSDYALGDRRRPQDVALLAPILARWGLRLEYEEGEGGARLAEREHRGTMLPVTLPGRFTRHDAGVADCTIEADGLVARCARGAGRIVLVADAALLDFEGPHPGAEAALSRLALLAFTDDGEIAGGGEGMAPEAAESGAAGAAVDAASHSESTGVEDHGP